MFHAVGDPEELSLNVTVSGAVPDLGDPQYCNTGFVPVVPVVTVT
ncbi:hypothetical protein MmTuc01_1654 [Methanosarcina mazei Tuc01]|uniref:Uncharacterized protein n=1 Tax=Methanosarcina mazei Tuc01 TaxID=1236903 RepID=M1QJ70_METMZ|nr:hypothetical protein MmTuc01_1654 [Methanosarcina mazei Tuc01]